MQVGEPAIATRSSERANIASSSVGAGDDVGAEYHAGRSRQPPHSATEAARECRASCAED
jgi:hypothetical protein